VDFERVFAAELAWEYSLEESLVFAKDFLRLRWEFSAEESSRSSRALKKQSPPVWRVDFVFLILPEVSSGVLLAWIK